MLLAIKPKPLLPVASVRYDRFGAAFIGEHMVSRFAGFNQFRADRTVMCLSTCQHKTQKTALGIANRMEITLADFSGPDSRLLARGLITEESSQHQ